MYLIADHESVTALAFTLKSSDLHSSPSRSTTCTTLETNWVDRRISAVLMCLTLMTTSRNGGDTRVNIHCSRFCRMRTFHQSVRVVTYNIHKCRGLDRRVRPGRIVDILGEIDADILALQEVLSVD